MRKIFERLFISRLWFFFLVISLSLSPASAHEDPDPEDRIDWNLTLLKVLKEKYEGLNENDQKLNNIERQISLVKANIADIGLMVEHAAHSQGNLGTSKKKQLPDNEKLLSLHKNMLEDLLNLRATLLSIEPIANSGNKWKVINFWADWCSSCRQEIPEFNRLAREFGDEIEVIGIDYEENSFNQSLRLAETLGIEFNTLRPGEYIKLNLDFPPALPATYILSPGNDVIEVLVGVQTFEALVLKLKSLGIINENINDSVSE